MSIINKVLNDLDKRNQHNGSGGGHGSAVAPPSRSGSRLLWLLLVVVMVTVAAVGYYVWNNASVSSTSQAADPVQQPPSQQPQSERSEPVKATASKPDTGSDKRVAEVAEENEAAPSRVAELELPEPIAVEPTPNEQQQSDDTASESEQRASTGSFSKQSVQLTAAEVAERQRQKAEQAQKQGLFTDAASHYEAALNAQPQWHDVRKEWAALEYGRGQTTQALAILREGLQQFPQAHSLRLLAASMLEKQAQPQLALQLLVQHQPAATELPQYYQLQAELAQQLDDNDAMQQSYRALVNAQPDNGRWRLGLALALREQHPQQALAEFEQAAARIEHTPTLNFIAEQIKRLRSQHATSTP
ncbi:hypothetical protein C5610_01390 [Idiomarina sp. OT37-5b]|uniref:hypothetical protein n=1 Tax=Idiomarina sp. OT37-5b TaxID=2100422 RepID=UPI000CF848B2|nr:hypothetical protein [Idiomarina sp. OT37-5b]AVJ55066.1 hypothetical protein C5610_01390 [Idiomarina sp. OT37-5b]